MSEVDRIPTVDFMSFRSGEPSQQAECAEQIGATLQEYGFVSLVGHGIRKETIEDAFKAAEEFFALPETTKKQVQDKQNNRGYIPIFDSTTPNQKPSGLEAFSIGHPDRPSNRELEKLPFYAPTPWPTLASFRERIEPCYRALYLVGEQILQAVAIHLGAPKDFFEEMSRDTYSNMRIIHYPPQERVAATADFGVNAHVDRGLLTLLIQDQNGGLSVLAPDDRWLPVVPNPDAIVVNCGSLLRRWTNGRYAAALHRVLNSSGRERYSIPLFMHPSYTTRIDPATLVGEVPSGPDFQPIVAGQEVFEGFKRDRPSWSAPTS